MRYSGKGVFSMSPTSVKVDGLDRLLQRRICIGLWWYVRDNHCRISGRQLMNAPHLPDPATSIASLIISSPATTFTDIYSNSPVRPRVCTMGDFISPKASQLAITVVHDVSFSCDFIVHIACAHYSIAIICLIIPHSKTYHDHAFVWAGIVYPTFIAAVLLAPTEWNCDKFCNSFKAYVYRISLPSYIWSIYIRIQLYLLHT